MGRAKLNMELIPKEKSRNVTYKKRKEGLVRKMHEFTTLCDVSACMIIYGPKQQEHDSEPETWPRDPDEVRRIVDIYRAKSKDSGNKTFGLPDFFHDRKRKIEDELAKLRKKNLEAKYPTCPDFMGLMTEARLREFAASLMVKADHVRSRIEQLRRSVDSRGVEILDIVRPDNLDVGPAQYPAVDYHHHYQNNSMMMMLLMNENEHRMQFGPVGPNVSYKRQQVLYETMGVQPAGVMGHSPKQQARYYGLPMAVVQPPYVQMVPPMQLPMPMLQFPKGDGGFGNDVMNGGIDDDGVGQEDVVNQYYSNNNISNRVKYYE
ncbi:MADS-box transcription factor family protein [Striga hermonthica]|uniref:MADS-box transcription factor family protein n=1 Tax=Striga hermonthica TaxID=68872 RepID=A0A9N7RQ84_STRHE|nr:MADS-box transcription factor family protein [Striga hermonthica]